MHIGKRGKIKPSKSSRRAEGHSSQSKRTNDEVATAIHVHHYPETGDRKQDMDMNS